MAVALAFLAVLSGLVTPSSMLAKEVQTGKLSGLCSSTTAFTGVDQSDEPDPNPHCDWCGSSVVASILLPEIAIPSFPGTRVVTQSFASDTSAAIVGLPFNRGPPTA